MPAPVIIWMMDLNSLLHKDPVEVNPARGQLLLAEPLMNDGIFSRSAIILLERDSDGGHIGLALNKGPVCMMEDIFPQLPNVPGIPIYQGGPVEVDRLFMLHCLGDRFSHAMEIAPGLYVGAREDEVISFILDNPETEGKIRFFLGYSGWGKGQLTSEIMRNTWALNPMPDTGDLLVGSGDEYWRREVERLGEDYRSWLIVPENPSLN